MDETSDPLQNAISQVTAAIPRTLDNRLSVLSARMLYISGSFFFASFYFGLVYLQIVNENNMWLPKGVNHPPTWVGVSEMALVLIAGTAYFWGQWFGLYRRKLQTLTIGLWVAAVLSVVSVVIHVIELHKPGFSLQSGGYVSLFITIEGVFTVVLAVTTLALIGFAIRASRGLFGDGAGAGVEAFGEWYGWISAIALFNFLALYVQPFFPIA